VPLADWLRGPLREWAEALLDPARLHADGLLNSDAVTALKDAHMTGLADHGARLWNVLMLHGWLDNRHRRTSDA
jgi:asparagine synthase (glutamine-hydrolysing)